MYCFLTTMSQQATNAKNNCTIPLFIGFYQKKDTQIQSITIKK